MTLGAALALGLAISSRARAQATDSSFARFELGGSSDVTNERFYEDTFDDTTLTGRRLSSSPEYRTAGVAALDAAGQLLPGTRYRLRQEGTAGDRLLRSYTRVELRGDPRDGMRLTLTPELDMRRDRSFGDDRRELRFRPDGRVRWTSLDHADLWDVLVGGDWFRNGGTSQLVTLDRNAGRAWLRWAHAPLESSWESELGYGADARAFPDSIHRDHVEQHGALTLRRLLPGGGQAALDAQIDRRTPVRSTPSTRDHFWSGRADGSAIVRMHDALTGELSVSLEGYRYDDADTSVYFDYTQLVAEPGFRWQLARDWGLRAGPRFEWLFAPRVPSERYRQVSAVIEAERLQGGDWWSFSPAAGWRQYDRSSSTLSLAEPDLHSSYLFIEGELFSDMGLPGRTRLRFTGSARYENHEDPAQDASSLYFSVDFRRGF